MTYLEPLLALVCAISVIGLFRVPASKARSMAWLGLLGLFLVTWPPLDWVFSRPLEIWYPTRLPDPKESPQAIVVLSSAVDPPQRERPYPLADYETYQRCQFAAWLYSHWQAVPVLTSGGGSRRHPFSISMKKLLEQEGVPDSMIWTEEASRSTHENAAYSAQILRQHGVSKIALVVDASSMPRAAACFRKEAIQVIPTPSEFCEFETFRDEVLPGWRALRQNEITLHETLALGWYWLRGWI
ncbi:MAG TPA: YdcF family protein [Bryobacteraceae bacterium]|nr:YdcF family protein [Bryobacteraceae bacterium]